MNKKIALTIILVSIVSISLVSAGWFDDIRTKDSFSKTTQFEKRTEFEDRWKGGHKKITTNYKETIKIEQESVERLPRYRQYEKVRPSNWRFKRPYNSGYFDTDRDRYDYYYEPRYDRKLGHYNWRW